MEYIRHYTQLSFFFLPKETFDTYLSSAKNQLIQKCFLDKMNDFDEYHIIQFKKIYWNNMKIELELEKVRRVKQDYHKYAFEKEYPKYSVYMINNKEYNYENARKLIEEMKPFDLELQLISKDELISELHHVKQLYSILTGDEKDNG